MRNSKKLRAQCQSDIRKAHNEYLEGIFSYEESEDKPSATKRFWSYTNSQRKDSSSVAPLKSEGVLVSDAQGKAEILNKQYTSVFTNEDKCNVPQKEDANIPTLPEIRVDPPGVEKLLKNLKPDKASGPDQISPRVLRELATELSVPLVKVFQSSIDT